MKKHYKKIISPAELDLKTWVALMEKQPKDTLFCSWCFPTDSIKDEFLEHIEDYSDDFIVQLIEYFLWPAGHFGSDEKNLEYLFYLLKKEPKKAKRLLKESKYYSNLLKDIFSRGKEPLFSGTDWVVNLLPDYLDTAMQVLEAYFIAHISYLPDQRIHGLSDVMAIIRAKYYEFKHPSEILESIGCYNLEYLVAYLYSKMGYEVKITKRTHDGGRDIIASKSEPGLREKNLIQCKNCKKNERVDTVRALLGVVSAEKASKGTLVITAKPTWPAKKFIEENRLDAIDNRDLQKLLNKHLGSNWPNHLDYYINRAIKEIEVEVSKC